MKKILLIAVTTLGMSSVAAQAATLPRLTAISTPSALTTLPTLATPSASRPLAGLYPLVNGQVLSNVGRVGSSLFTGPLNLPLLGTPLSGFFGKINNVIVGAVKVIPPVPPRNDPPTR
ncbi:acid shock protein [Nevskia ramosa]|uniref:acid shock protein n=1 Tax=Nevskia ramosa TaxID=64002 RepID=UPI003D14665B